MSVQNIQTSQFQQLIQQFPQIQIIDVRTPAETSLGMIPQAQAIDFFGGQFLELAQSKLKLECPVLVYCQSGGRSSSAAAILAAHGYTTFNMRGGYSAWR